MVLIFGWGAGEAQDLGEVAPAVCPNCHNHVYMHHIRSEKKVSLYFVPLIPYGSNEYLACPTCRHGLQLRPDQRAEVESMQSATSLYRRGRYPAATFGPRVERFWAGLGVAPSGDQVVRPAPALPPAPTGGGGQPTTATAAPLPPETSLTDRLQGLAKLHSSGVLTDEEFAAAKRRLLEI